jgi:hypothetical protein
MTTPTMYRYCAKEDDGLTEGAYCSCTAGSEMYVCFFLILYRVYKKLYMYAVLIQDQ